MVAREVSREKTRLDMKIDQTAGVTVESEVSRHKHEANTKEMCTCDDASISVRMCVCVCVCLSTSVYIQTYPDR